MQLPNRPYSLSSQLSVLCIIDTLGRGGGAEQLVASLALPLRQRGVEVEFVDLFSWHDDLGIELQRQGFVVHRLELRSRWNLVQGIRQLRMVVGVRKDMIFWGHLYFGNLYASLFGLFFPGLTSVITLHSSGLAQIVPHGIKGRLSNALERWVNCRSHFKIAVSGAVRAVYSSVRGWNTMRVIHNGVNVDAIPTGVSAEKRVFVRNRFAVGDKDFLIAVPARFVPEKGHTVLLDAVKHLACQHSLHPMFLLIGQHTPLVDTLQKKAKDIGIPNGQMHYLPTIPQDDLYDLLCCADAVVLPSVQEAFGIAAVEAMATERPVILSRVGGMAELDPNGECVIYVPPGDARELGNAIAALMEDPTGLNIRGRCGRRLASVQFSLDSCAIKWHQLFVEIHLRPKFRS